MSNKLVSIVLMLIGVLVFAASLLADSIGIGREPGLGMLQLVGAAAGLVVALIGLRLFFKRKS